MSDGPTSPPGDGHDDAELERAALVASTRPEAFGMDLAVEAGVGTHEEDLAPQAPGATAGMARNTAIFSIATGASRVAGLAREVVAASYFGTSGAASAFTIAFQVPNLVRALFADAALSAAFVPVFSEYLEQGKRREAVLLASTLFWIILLVLGAITAIFIVGAGVLMPLFIPGTEFTPSLVDLTIGLSQILFPIVVLLGINGLLVGIAHAYHQFTLPALAPLVWNIVIIGALVALQPLFEGDDRIYAYAIGVLLGTIVQLAMVVPALGRIDFRLKVHLNWRDPGVKRVFILMLPVTIGLGVINVNLLVNSMVGALISESAPRAIDAAFRIYMLPQGMFSVALATVLFPSLSRLVARGDTPGLRGLLGTGTRQNLLLLIPAAAVTMALAAPITELIYQYGSFGAASTDEVSQALFWFSFSLPFAGVNLLFTRTFFSLQRPWIPTALAALTLIVNVAAGAGAVRATRHRRAGDRHRGRVGPHGARAGPPAARPARRADRGPRDGDRHGQDRRRVRSARPRGLRGLGDPRRGARGCRGAHAPARGRPGHHRGADRLLGRRHRPARARGQADRGLRDGAGEAVSHWTNGRPSAPDGH